MKGSFASGYYRWISNTLLPSLRTSSKLDRIYEGTVGNKNTKLQSLSEGKLSRWVLWSSSAQFWLNFPIRVQRWTVNGVLSCRARDWGCKRIGICGVRHLRRKDLCGERFPEVFVQVLSYLWLRARCLCRWGKTTRSLPGNCWSVFESRRELLEKNHYHARVKQSYSYLINTSHIQLKEQNRCVLYKVLCSGITVKTLVL